MHRDLLVTPLQQALVLLWLAGLVQLASWPALRPIGGTWVVSALLAGLLSVLVAGRLRRVGIFPIVAVTGLGGLLGTAELAGVSTPTLWNLTVLYGLLLWLAVLGLLRLPLTRRLTALLDLSGGWGARGGRRSVETAIHWSCFALVLAGCCLPAAGRPVWSWGSIPTGSLAALALALVFLLLAGRRYRLVLHAHLSVAIGVWLGLSLYAWLAAPPGQTGVSPQDPLAGLLLGVMGLGSLALAGWMARGSPAAEPRATGFDASLFAEPLTHWAMALASVAALQALALALSGWSGPAACAIAALTFLLGSRTLRWPILTLAGASLAVLTLTWTYSTAVHGAVPFGLRPGGSAGVDQWLVLVLLTLAVAVLGRFLMGDPEREKLYARSLLLLAWGLFAWSLAGALVLLATAAHGSAALAMIWLLTAGALFPLLGPAPGVAYWRGAAVAVLASLLVISLVGPTALALVGPAAAVAWAYLLWIMGNLVLPRLDRQLGGWAVGGESWSWVGLLILGLAAALAGLEVLGQWAVTLGAAGYLFLLSRNTRLPIAWAAVALCAWSGLSWTGFGSGNLGQWLVLGLVTVALGSLSRFLLRYPDWYGRLVLPLFALSWFLWGWALIGGLILLSGAAAGSAGPALVFLLAAAALFPLLGPTPDGVQWRGTAIGLLASLVLVSLMGPVYLQQSGTSAALAWAYTLWLGGNWVLPRWNQRLPGWAVAGESWPWIGLLILGLAAAVAGPEMLRQWAVTLGAAGYLFLLSRNTRLPIAWAAVALCAWSGLSWTGFGSGSLGQWLVLGLVTVALGSLSRFLLRYPDWYGRLVLPLFALSWFLWGWALIGGLILLSGAVAGSVGFALVFLLAAAALFPLLGPSTDGARWRGAAIGLLASLVLASLLGPVYLLQWVTLVALAWAYALWLLGNWVLPLWNQRVPGWSVAGESWPWVGLAAIVLGIYLTGSTALLQEPLAVGVAGYLFLLCRNTSLPVYWLAVAAFAWAGVVWSGLAHLPGAPELSLQVLSTSAIMSLLWANLLLLLAPAWDRYGAAVTSRLGLPDQSLRVPLVTSALALCLIWTFGVAVWALPPALGWNGAVIGEEPSGVSAIPAALLLSLTYLNLLWQWRGRVAADLTSLGAALALLVIWAELQPFSLAVLGALWCGLLTGLTHLLGRRPHCLSTLAAAAAGRWLAPSMVVATALLFLPPAVPIGERLASFGLLTGVAAYAGWHRPSRAWLVIATIMGLALVHGLWLLWVPVERVPQLLPAYALQTALLTWLVVWMSERARRRQGEPDIETASLLLTKVLASTSPWLAALAVLEWAGQGLLLLLHVVGDLPAPPSSDLAATLAYVAATTVLVKLCVHQARLSQRSNWVYAAAALVGSAALYLRLLRFGLAPLTPWDTAAIMASAYGLFLVGRLTLSRPVFQLMMALPLLALATVPYQLGSAHSALTLLAAGALYLLTRRTLHTETPLYLGLLAINGAIYLWLPDWSERFGLFQVYLVPAALTVLLLLHLHRRELKRGVLHAARLGTLAALYAAATLDVFLVDSLWVFALTLAVSLVGILMGISLRIRAFLYAGVAFLVLNVAGQLILLYPEHRLGKALLLMGLGTLITGAMIWFNLKRELFLQQVRAFRADLAQWA